MFKLDWVRLAAPLMALPEPAPKPLGAPLTTTHRVISYTYPSTSLRTGDSLYRLTDAEYSTSESFAYTYDSVGNRVETTRRIVSTASEETITYQYDAANHLTSVDGVVYTWDNNGNLLSDGLRSYSYDHANRLTQVVSGTLTTEFAYPSTLLRAGNGAGDRVAKTVDGVTTDYVLDGSTGLTTGPAAGLTQVLVESTGGQQTAYLYGHDDSTGLTTGSQRQ